MSAASPSWTPDPGARLGPASNRHGAFASQRKRDRTPRKRAPVATQRRRMASVGRGGRAFNSVLAAQHSWLVLPLATVQLWPFVQPYRLQMYIPSLPPKLHSVMRMRPVSSASEKSSVMQGVFLAVPGCLTRVATPAATFVAVGQHGEKSLAHPWSVRMALIWSILSLSMLVSW